MAAPIVKAQMQPIVQTQYVLPSGLPLGPQSPIVRVAPTAQPNVLLDPVVLQPLF